MICPTCHGRGSIDPGDADKVAPVILCPDCVGFGIIHCCDGLTADNEVQCDADVVRQPR